MFRVERHDITGDCYSSWATFEEANTEFERQVQDAIGYADDTANVILSVSLRYTTVGKSLDEQTKGASDAL